MCTTFHCSAEPVASLTAFKGVEIVDRGRFCDRCLTWEEKRSRVELDATFISVRRFTPPVPVRTTATGAEAA